VVNGIPFALPEVGGVCIFDASALARFFESGTLALQLPFQVASGQKLVWRHHLPIIWSGEKPTADDLLREMKDPFQVRSIMAHYKMDVHQFQLSNKMIGLMPFTRRRMTDVPELLKSLGAENAEAELREIVTTIKKIKTTGRARQGQSSSTPPRSRLRQSRGKRRKRRGKRGKK
jgi:hypothetical protein